MLRQDKVIILGVNTTKLRAKNGLSFVEQAQFLVNDLKIQLDQLIKTKNADLLIVVLHEYALYDKYNKIIPYQHRAHFEGLIQKLTEQYKNLFIIGGTVLYAKSISRQDQYTNLFNRYNESHAYVESTQSYLAEFNKQEKYKNTASKYTRNISYAVGSLLTEFIRV